MFAHLEWSGRPVRVEYEWVGAEAGPVMVFLHEGLGSLSMWRDFPARLSKALGMRGLVYLHLQAREVLPPVLEATGASSQPTWLYGHSDGGSIALLYASMYPDRVTGLVVAAPHVFVEEFSIAAIEEARVAYMETDLRARLARHHEDVDSAFWGWNDIWLHEPFRAWNIEDEIAAIRAPVLAIQGVDDEYGTLEQIRRIARRVPGAETLELERCGHSPHRDQPDAVIAATVRFAGSR